jgi:hypothetical protein
MLRIDPVNRFEVFLGGLPPDAAVLIGAVGIRGEALILKAAAILPTVEPVIRLRNRPRVVRLISSSAIVVFKSSWFAGRIGP